MSKQKLLEQTIESSGKSQRRWHRRVPYVMQLSAVECGAACLAMILCYYGRKTTVSELREREGIGRDGLSAATIVKTAQRYGLRARGVALRDNDFRYIPLPAILHWEFNHFVILERWTPKYAEIVDPALGHRRIKAAEFDTSFTGVVITLEPGVQFRRYAPPTKLSIRGYMARYAMLAPVSLVQILIASLLLQLFGLGAPVLTKIIVDNVLPHHMLSVLPLLIIGMLIFCLSQLVIMQLRSSILLYLQGKVDSSMVLGFVEHMLTLSLPYFQQRSSGDLLARLSSNSVLRDTLSNQLVSSLLDGIFVLAYLILLMVLSRTFGLVVLGIACVQILLLLLVQRPIRELAGLELQAQGKAQGYIVEMLNGIATLKAAGVEQRSLARWSNLFFAQLNASIRRGYLSMVIETLMTTLNTLSPLILLWIGATQILQGTMQVGTMLALNALAASFLAPLSSIVSSAQQLQLVRSHLERIADVMQAEPEQQLETVQPAPQLTGRITLEQVAFRYDAQAGDVLKNISLQIEPGQKVAIVGRTGSGKSTLGKLLLGLYVPTQGEIRYDGIPLRMLNYQSVRTQFGVVMQDAVIFGDTIRQNIAFNNPDMDMARIVEVTKMAALHEDISQMPMGYETFVAEGGSALSGGQRQRLALARALAHAPVILLLDEATSSLDVTTEQTVEQNLSAVPCTQIIIAHRLSTVRHADVILVLDGGNIVERGTHHELLQKNGYYAKLIQNQLSENEEKIASHPFFLKDGA
ncbi:MAG TPA: peptidase domain-containing ABC transporter [Ktedonobacteraceae bacterium]|jgi:ABC-type bacteriocin/lantibiotic exporter with double-glycine peptidase domain|nr:peptidase domain-containing ABC transporter [Ktedonobacteraceae bacterium]